MALAAALLCAMWLGGMFHAWFFAPDIGVVLLSNESSETIASVQVSVCGQTFRFSDVVKGRFAFARYDVASDSHYEVKVAFRSGRAMESEIGYVTNGGDFFDVIEITDDKIIHAERSLPERQ